MTFFYDLNKKLDEIRATPSTTHGQLNERDMGKHNNATTGFAALAKKAGKEYGSKAAGERVAGAVKAKMAKAGKLEEENLQELSPDTLKSYQAKNMDAGRMAMIRGDEKTLAKRTAGKHAAEKQLSAKGVADEGMGDVAKKVGGLVKKVGGAVLDKLGHGSDEDMIRDLQKKAGVPQTGKKPMATPNEGVDKEKFAALAPPKDKITFADKIAGAKKEVDEMLGDVAAEAIKGALSPKQKKIDMNKNGKLDANDFAMLRKGGKQETDEGWDDMMKDVEKRRQMKVGDTVKGHKGDITKTATGVIHTRRYDPKTGETDTGDDTPAPGEKRGRGRPKKAGGPSQERVTAKSRKADRTTWQKKTNEGDNEGDDVKQAMAVLKRAGYKVSKAADGAEELDEKAVSKKQQRFMGMVHATQKGEKAPSKEVAKVAKTMKKKDAEDFASTKHKGLPEKKKPEGKKKEKTEEAGGSGTPTASSGFSFGKGIYDSMNRELETMIAESMARLDESMNVSMNMNSDAQGGPSKSLTVTATDDDALKLGTLLKNAGLGDGGEPGGADSIADEIRTAIDDHGDEHGEEPCPSCGSSDCGCEEEVDEAYGDNVVSDNQPDWPTNTEQAADNFEYSGGLNKPKSSGMATMPVTDVQVDGEDNFSKPARMNEEDDLARMMEMAGAAAYDYIDYVSPSGEQPPEDLITQNGVEYDPDTNVISVRNATSLAQTHRAIEAAGWKKQTAAARRNPSGAGQAQVAGDTPYQLREDELARMMEMAGVKKKTDEEKTEEGNLFTGNLAKARADGKKQADLDGDGDMEKVQESVANLWKEYKVQAGV